MRPCAFFMFIKTRPALSWRVNHRLFLRKMPFIYLDFHSRKLCCIRVDGFVFSHDRKKHLCTRVMFGSSDGGGGPRWGQHGGMALPLFSLSSPSCLLLLCFLLLFCLTDLFLLFLLKHRPCKLCIILRLSSSVVFVPKARG